MKKPVHPLVSIQTWGTIPGELSKVYWTFKVNRLLERERERERGLLN
jgi:hypothetical protein